MSFRTLVGWCIAGLLTLSVVSPALAQDGASEYQIKAAFLFNLAKFVDWPAEAFKSPDEPFAICILGENPFGSSLVETVRGKQLGNRGFAVREVSTSQETGRCHILFVVSAQMRRFRTFTKEIAGSNVLTVGESPDFTASGGIVNLKLQDARVKIEIDPACAERAKLRISSKLLSLAQIAKR